ncbi:MAG: hypothetical protein FWF06_08700, partial [Symbiobacteriaceae bacterium]|nr:hypothetical protein [Symbiobacteriaceae bacterium]
MRFLARRRETLKYMALFTVFFLVISWPLDFIIFRPGKAYLLRDMVTVPDSTTSTGSFMMTVVLSQQATLPLLIRGWLSPSWDIYPRLEIMPQDVNREEYHELMLLSMQSSQKIATGLALRELGYAVPETGKGVLVHTVTPGSLALGLLQSGDILTALNGEVLAL